MSTDFSSHLGGQNTAGLSIKITKRNAYQLMVSVLAKISLKSERKNNIFSEKENLDFYYHLTHT